MTKVFQPLRSLDDALAELLGHARPLSRTEEVSTFEADCRVLAQDVVSELHVPGFDNSAMDGYALRMADAPQAGALLQVTQRIAAGHFGRALHAGEAARIFTGAPVPEGADAVVMQEDVIDLGDVHQGRVQINAAPRAGQWIRKAGEDIAQGAVVLSNGQLLNPASLGLLASVGLAQVLVQAPVRVALFSTGDELVMPGAVAPSAMKPGAIYNSNRFFLRALLKRLGCEVTDMGIVPDQRQATIDVLQSAAQQHDLILTSGGVSVGEEDHVKPAVQALGSLDLWAISMKPGKPFAYGKVGASHFIGLPGNPVSSYATFLLLVRPFVGALLGQQVVATPSIALPAHFTLALADKRREFLRARRNAAGGVELYPNQSSGVLTSMAWADGLVDNPAFTTIAHGDTVRFIPLSELH